MVNIGHDEFKEIKKSFISDMCFALIALIIVSFFFFTTQFWISTVQVQHTSMCNTLQEGDILIIDRLREPKRGDVVVFKHSENDDYIKRVIAVEGDTIYTINGIVHLEYEENGVLIDHELEETYLHDNLGTYKYYAGSVGNENVEIPRTLIKKGQIFVMGDNRLVSYDSRRFDAINLDSLKGVVPQFFIKHKSVLTFLFNK